MPIDTLNVGKGLDFADLRGDLKMNRRKLAISTAGAAVAAAKTGSGLSSIKAEAQAAQTAAPEAKAVAAFQGDDRQDVQGIEAGFPAAVQKQNRRG
jgi:hypothetical protein